jgi:hypothetical protein
MSCTAYLGLFPVSKTSTLLHNFAFNFVATFREPKSICPKQSAVFFASPSRRSSYSPQSLQLLRPGLLKWQGDAEGIKPLDNAHREIQMGLEALRAASKNSNADDDSDFYDPRPPVDFDEPKPPQPGDREYSHFVLYDEARFPTDGDRERLLALARACPREDLIAGAEAEPADLPWILVPARAEGLSIEEQLCTKTSRFQDQGYILEINRLRLGRRRPPRLNPSRAAWNAFFANVVMADAILTACRELPPHRRGNFIFRNAQDDVLVPIIGKRNKDDFERGTTILAEHRGLLAAPRTFDAERVAYPADAHTFAAALKNGRCKALPVWSINGRYEIIERMKIEIAAWAAALGHEFSMDGLVLRAAQVVGLLRIQATDWALREKNGYVMSGTQWTDHRARAPQTKERYAEKEHESIMDGLQPPGNEPQGNFVMPTIKRPPDSAVRDVLSILAGGIGLADEAASRDEFIAQMNWSRSALGGLADWVSRLRRFHRESLTRPIADLIREMMTGEGYDLDDLHVVGSDIWSAAGLIRSQFPDQVWNTMIEYAEHHLENAPWIDVRYRWNDNPVEPPTIEPQDEALVISGPLLTMNAQAQRQWAQHAELFRQQGALTV